MFESLSPPFLCPKCGWQMSDVGAGDDVLPVTVSFVLLLVAGAVLAAPWRLALGLAWAVAVLAGRRQVLYRCPICGGLHSDRELAGTDSEQPPD